MSLQAKTAAKTSRLNIFHTTKRQVCACQVPRAKGLRQMEVDGKITTRPSLRNGARSSAWICVECAACRVQKAATRGVEARRTASGGGEGFKDWGWVRKTAVSRRQMSKYPARVKCLTFWLRPQQMHRIECGERTNVAQWVIRVCLDCFVNYRGVHQNMVLKSKLSVGASNYESVGRLDII